MLRANFSTFLYATFNKRIFCYKYPELPIYGSKNLTLASWNLHTGKSLSNALIFASTNPQYDNRLFIIHFLILEYL